MKRLILVTGFLMVVAVSPWACGNNPTFTDNLSPTFTPVPGSPTDTPLPSSTPTSTPTVTTTGTATASPTVTDTKTESPTPSITGTPTSTATVTATRTATASPTVTDTKTISPTPTITGTPTPTGTATDTPTVTNTRTATHTPTITSTATATRTPTPMTITVSITTSGLSSTGFIYSSPSGSNISGGLLVLSAHVGDTINLPATSLHTLYFDAGSTTCLYSGVTSNQSYTFATPGTYYFHCGVHASGCSNGNLACGSTNCTSMAGVVTVN